MPVDGSYISVSLKGPLIPTPAVISTFPFVRTAAVWSYRAVVKLPVPVHNPVDGSYNSALEK